MCDAAASNNLRECTAEMRCFVRGGVPGVAQLQRVFKNIFLHYDVFLLDDQCSIIKSLGGLSPSTRHDMLREVGWAETHPQTDGDDEDAQMKS